MARSAIIEVRKWRRVWGIRFDGFHDNARAVNYKMRIDSNFPAFRRKGARKDKKISPMPTQARRFAIPAFSRALAFLPVAIKRQKKQEGDKIMSDTINNTKKIAELNDLCRKAMGVAGKLFQTEGICALSEADQSAIREKVETFRDFERANDPYGERDFGAFEHEGRKIFWKIDYYDRTLTKGSEDPADPGQTVRVLTIMLASEY